jgi:hypothetical protein
VLSDEIESVFNDFPKNLIVLGDKKSGTIVLMHQDFFVSSKKELSKDNHTKKVNKFIVNINPRIMLVPSVA